LVIIITISSYCIQQIQDLLLLSTIINSTDQPINYLIYLHLFTYFDDPIIIVITIIVASSNALIPNQHYVQ